MMDSPYSPTPGKPAPRFQQLRTHPVLGRQLSGRMLSWDVRGPRLNPPHQIMGTRALQTSRTSQKARQEICISIPFYPHGFHPRKPKRLLCFARLHCNTQINLVLSSTSLCKVREQMMQKKLPESFVSFHIQDSIWGM